MEPGLARDATIAIVLTAAIVAVATESIALGALVLTAAVAVLGVAAPSRPAALPRIPRHPEIGTILTRLCRPRLDPAARGKADEEIVRVGGRAIPIVDLKLAGKDEMVYLNATHRRRAKLC